jgi:hypothetical protein
MSLAGLGAPVCKTYCLQEAAASAIGEPDWREVSEAPVCSSHRPQRNAREGGPSSGERRGQLGAREQAHRAPTSYLPDQLARVGAALAAAVLRVLGIRHWDLHSV